MYPFHLTTAFLCAATLVQADPPAGAAWKALPAFTDEFNGPTLDTAKWGTMLMNNWRGMPPAWQTDKNLTFEDGKLLIWTKAETLPEMTDGYKDFTTGCLRSVNRVRYGYFEIRAKVNRTHTTSAFWFYNDTPTLWTELDVFEIAGGNPQFKRTLNMDVHVIRAPGLKEEIRSHDEWLAPADLADDFHTYALEWDFESIRWYFDGQVIRKIKNDHWTQPVYLIIDSETIPGWFGLPDKKDLPAKFEIDYVRAWQKQS